MPAALVERDVLATFRALGDPVRLAIVEHLSVHEQATINELAEQFPISLQAVSRHVKVLTEAGVISQGRSGRERPVRLEPATVSAATAWLTGRLRHLESRHRQLDELLARLQEESPS